MRIKKLDIVGFKSFCDRMVLTFDDPITAVVGPNGCGKSNIVDAIRWCMGEQSAKHLRGKSMEDVIFAGSEGRGPMSMAEVSLTFENDGRVPIEYLDYAEITVTRRLFRDGDSDYLINKIPMRLRDVQDFFLGTGVGTKAYSIIEQGRIGLIVSSKPEDRRALIEEAAGITKYKSKKKAAEKKMEATRQNLLRVSDVAGEIDKRLGSLRRQAQKAERYKKYKAEIRDLELHAASHRMLAALAEDKVLCAALEAACDRRAALQTDLVGREAELDALRLQAAADERQAAGLQERLYEADNAIKLTESGVAYRRREADELQERALQGRGEIDELGRRAREVGGELERVAGESSRLDAEVITSSDELAVREDVARGVRGQLQAVQAAWEEARSRIAQEEARIARADGSQRNLERRRDETEVRLARLREEQAEGDGRQAELEGEVAAGGARLEATRAHAGALDGRRAEIEARLALLKLEVARGEAEIETLRTEIHRRRSRLTSLNEILDRYEGFQRGVRAIMHKGSDEGPSRPGIRGLVADIVEAPARYEAAVEAVLGDRLGSIIVESHQVGVEAIEFLKARAEGRSSFIPLELRGADGVGADGGGGDGLPHGDGVIGPMLELVGVDRCYDGVASYLMGDVVVVEDLPRALGLWQRNGFRKTLVTLEGEVVDPHGVVTGGSRDGDGAGVLQQKREIRELDEILVGLEAAFAEAEARQVERKTEVARLAEELEQVRHGRHQLELALLGLDKDVGGARAELERLARRRAVLGDELDEGERRREEARAELAETVATMAAARVALEAAQRQLSGTVDELARLRDLAEQAQQVCTELRVRAAQVGAQRAAARGHLGRLESERHDQGERAARLERTVDEAQARACALREEIEGLSGRLGGMVEERARLQEGLTAARGAYEERAGGVQRAEAELRHARGTLDAAGAEVGRLEVRARELELGRRHLVEQIADRYRLDLGAVLCDFHLRPPTTEADDRRLRELRELIERMGEINLMAIEECAELEQRHQFLTTQQQDLDRALAQLEHAIAKINKTSRRRFRATFDAVNAKFQEVFPRLFRGGHAELRLTDPADLLETGIEIVAQPPGKKNQAVELLSGGEKALTAVSLIFAIFLIKPSPFCLLDEVDAPLDEANVGRFNELVRELTDRSQFIIITHNKRTMQIADTLYGVTMEQPGISKLVAVNLSRLGSTQRAA